VAPLPEAAIVLGADAHRSFCWNQKIHETGLPGGIGNTYVDDITCP
jgi:hypothetical protein